MSRKFRHLTPEEMRLWRRVTARDKPLRPRAPEDALAAGESAPENPKTKNAVPAPIMAAKPKQVEKSAPKRAHDFGEEKRVRRGQIEVEGRIDLHGFTQIAAEDALTHFLSSAQRARKRTVLVVTGRGSMEPSWPAPQRGVLRRRLPEWLDALAREGIVAGYAPAHRAHGGDGAFYVFLKQRQL